MKVDHHRKLTMTANQQVGYPFFRGSHVWLFVPTAGKLDPKWECGWTVTQQIVEQPTVQIKHTDGRVRTVHIHRLRLHIIQSDPHTITPVSHDNQAPTATPDWQPPFFEHVIDDRIHEPVEDNTQDNTPQPVCSPMTSRQICTLHHQFTWDKIILEWSYVRRWTH